jgi:hypothetical protein
MRVEIHLRKSLQFLQHINYKTPLSDHDSLSHAQVLSVGKWNFLVIFTRHSLCPFIYPVVGRAIAQVVSRWLPTAEARVRARVWQVGFVVDKVALGQFSRSTSVSSANLYSANFSIITITRGRYNRPFSGRRAEWNKCGLYTPLCDKSNIPLFLYCYTFSDISLATPSLTLALMCYRMRRRNRLTNHAICQTVRGTTASVSVRINNRKRTNMYWLLRTASLH